MSRKVICCLLIAATCLCSCRKGERVIPRGKMAKIYAEMFVADQRLAGQPSNIRTAADTSWVYEPIFEKYGYTSDDYRASVAYYIQDANRFARILRQTASIIEGDIKALKKLKSPLDLREFGEIEEGRFAPEKVFYMTGFGNPDTFGTDTLRFYVDSTGGGLYFDARDWADTAFYGPVMVFAGDTVTVVDTLFPETVISTVASEPVIQKPVIGTVATEPVIPANTVKVAEPAAVQSDAKTKKDRK